LVVGIGELGLDIGLVTGRADQRRIAAGAEEQADRTREDRLAGAGLAGDRIEPRRELERRLTDQDEIADPEALEHGRTSSGAPAASPCSCRASASRVWRASRSPAGRPRRDRPAPGAV